MEVADCARTHTHTIAEEGTYQVDNEDSKSQWRVMIVMTVMISRYQTTDWDDRRFATDPLESARLRL